MPCFSMSLFSMSSRAHSDAGRKSQVVGQKKVTTHTHHRQRLGIEARDDGHCKTGGVCAEYMYLPPSFSYRDGGITESPSTYRSRDIKIPSTQLDDRISCCRKCVRYKR